MASSSLCLPPERILVKVKRKLDDSADDQIKYLRVDGSSIKRFRSSADNWLYKRQDVPFDLPRPETDPVPATLCDVKPTILVSQPGDENRPLQRKIPIKKPSPAANPTKSIPTITINGTRPPAARLDLATRRFHLKRGPAVASSGLTNDARKTRFNRVLFVEKSHRVKKPVSSVRRQPKTIRASLIPHQPSNEITLQKSERIIAVVDSSIPKVESHLSSDASLPPRPPKPPGSIARSLGAKNGERKHPELPKSMLNRWEYDMDQLARDMDAYTLEYIAANMAKVEKSIATEAVPPNSTTSTPPSTHKPSTPGSSQFKPKAPALRYFERHPEALQPQENEIDKGESSDDDYLIQTFVRVPAASLMQVVLPEQVGLIEFDREPDAELFYGGESESEDEFPEDEDDENAENYYTADYPEDEIDSDDEYGRDPYKYRTGNASDLEEYDITWDGVDSAERSESDDDDEDKVIDGETDPIREFHAYVKRGGRARD